MTIFSHECEPSPVETVESFFFFFFGGGGGCKIKKVMFNSNREGRVEKNTQFPFCGSRKA